MPGKLLNACLIRHHTLQIARACSLQNNLGSVYDRGTLHDLVVELHKSRKTLTSTSLGHRLLLHQHLCGRQPPRRTYRHSQCLVGTMLLAVHPNWEHAFLSSLFFHLPFSLLSVLIQWHCADVLPSVFYRWICDQTFMLTNP